MHTDMLRDSPTHVDTLSDTPLKTQGHTHTHPLADNHRQTHIDRACSGFPDMTSCCREM